MNSGKKTGAQVLVECLAKEGVKYIFGIPGAKIDAVFDALSDGGPELILCRHEQNAAFMAGCVGRLTGTPGVVVVTSGPGVSNLTTGLATATTEGDPIVAIGGAVPRSMRLKHTHQNLDNVSIMKPVTKSSVEVVAAENIPEIVQNAFRTAREPRGGAAFISVPQDVLSEIVEDDVPDPVLATSAGPAPHGSIVEAANMINEAKNPVLLLGLETSKPINTMAVRSLLQRMPIATIETFEASGLISRKLLDVFVGRVGLFNNQPGDRLLEKADVVMTIGFDPVEYDPEAWNADKRFKIIHLDTRQADIGRCYRPQLELIGDIATSLDSLMEHLEERKSLANPQLVQELRAELDAGVKRGADLEGSPIHPLRFIHDLQETVGDNVTVISDVGSHYMWLARHFRCYRPHHLLFSNGQQTLGVALPWAMATSLVRPEEKVVSISGDGGFLFSSMELETAVRNKMHFVHFVWRDGAYDMVAIQERKKYGRESGVHFGKLDLVKFAESFGAQGFELHDADELIPTLNKALEMEGPVLIDVPIDYRDNDQLFAYTDYNVGH